MPGERSRRSTARVDTPRQRCDLGTRDRGRHRLSLSMRRIQDEKPPWLLLEQAQAAKQPETTIFDVVLIMICTWLGINSRVQKICTLHDYDIYGKDGTGHYSAFGIASHGIVYQLIMIYVFYIKTSTPWNAVFILYIQRESIQ